MKLCNKKNDFHIYMCVCVCVCVCVCQKNSKKIPQAFCYFFSFLIVTHLRIYSRKQSTHRRQNWGTFRSIARDKQFDPVSEIVHRSSGTSQRRQNDIDLFHQRRSERTFTVILSKWAQLKFEIMCRCAYPQEILIPFFFSDLRPFWT